MHKLVFQKAGLGQVWLVILGEKPLPALADTSPYFKVEGIPLWSHDLVSPPDTSPCFFDWQRIVWTFMPENPMKVTCWVEGKKVAESATATTALGKEIYLQHHIGLSSWEIRDEEGRMIWRLTMEVFPHRMAYQEDFRLMQESMVKSLGRLALSNRSRNSSGYDFLVSQTEEASNPVGLFQALRDALHRIQVAPASQLGTSSQWVQEHQVRKPDFSLMRRQSARSQSLPRYPDRKSDKRLNVAANRWLLFRLYQLEHTILAGNQHDSLFVNRQLITDFLRRYRQQAMWNGVEWEKALSEGRPIHTSVVYTHVEHLINRLLSARLRPSFRFPAFQLKDLPTLYEYACYLKLADAILAIPGFRVDSHQNVWKAEGEVSLTLVKGEDSRVSFVHPERGDRVTLWYNRRFSKKETGGLAQQPDMLMDVQKGEEAEVFRYVIEVKYQAEKGKSGWGPPAEGIRQAHRYRDALISGQVRLNDGVGATRVQEAVVCFPLPYDEEEGYTNHDAYQSLDKIGVGALPLLPHKSNLLFQDWLTSRITPPSEVLWESRLQYYPDGRQLRAQLLNERVGIVRLREGSTAPLQKKFIRQKRILGIPYNHPLPSWKSILMVTQNGLWASAKIQSIEHARAADLRALGMNWPLRAPEGKYLLVFLSTLDQLHIPITSPLPPETNQYALTLASQTHRVALLFLRTRDMVKRYQEVIAFDPLPRFVWENGDLVGFYFRAKGKSWELLQQNKQKLLWRLRGAEGDQILQNWDTIHKNLPGNP